MPLILELLDQFGHAKVYTKIDLCRIYNLVCIREGDEWKAMFKTCYNHFECVVMPFGLTNALVVFQHLMNNVSREYLDDFVVYYIDDIFIFSKNMEDHEHHVRLVLDKFWEVGPYANWKSVNSINMKWNSWITSFLEITFAWIFARFRPLLIKLFQLLFEMSNIFKKLLTFIDVSLPIIFQ
jgi:hypothetical protein